MAPLPCYSPARAGDGLVATCGLNGQANMRVEGAPILKLFWDECEMTYAQCLLSPVIDVFKERA